MLKMLLHKNAKNIACRLRNSSCLIFCLALILFTLNSSAQLFINYPSNVQTLTSGTAITPIVPNRAGVNWYGFKAAFGRLDVSPDFMDYPTGIAAGKDGQMYVGNMPNGRGVIRKFTPTGILPTPTFDNDPRTGAFTTVGSGFSVPLGVATDGTYIYVADQAVGVKRTLIATNATTNYGSGFSQPVSIALNRKGEVYVGQYNGTIKKISANGASTTNFGPSFTYPGGIVVDHQGNVFISDFMAKTVTKLNPNGAVLDTFTGFTSPFGLAIDNGGNLFIADANSIKMLTAGSTSANVAVALNTQHITAVYQGVAIDAKGIIYGTNNELSNLTYLYPKGGFFITPALPSGLVFDYNSGTISGTPLEGSAEQEYTIYGYDSNSTQVTGTVRLNVVSANANLAALSASSGTLTPNFDADVLEYELGVSNASIKLTPTLEDLSASVTVNGVATASGTASADILLSPGISTIPVVVTASDGTSKSYSVRVNQAVGLNNLSLSSGTLSPAFNPNVFAYAATVQPSINNVLVTPVANHPSHLITVNNIAISAQSPSATVTLENGTNTIEVEVTTADGLSSKSYTITINKLLAQTITFPALGTKATGIEDFAPATSDSGLPITYTTSSTARATIVSGKIHLVSAGTVIITAKQAGNGTYAAATDVAQNMTIVKGPGVITFPDLAEKTVGDANFAPGAKSTNTVSAITYTSSNTAVATITGSGNNLRIRIVGAGTTNITANQAASTNYLASIPVVQTLKVNKIPVSLTLADLEHTYDGTAKSATFITDLAGLTGVSFTYNGSSTPPSQAGIYDVVATLSNATYGTDPVNGKLIISKATATLNLEGLSQVYDGSPKLVTAVTLPIGLTDIVYTYNGSTTAPTSAGSYTVVATLDNINYSGAVTGTLVVAKAAAIVSLEGHSQVYDGSPKLVTAVTLPIGLTDIVYTYNGSTTAPTSAGSYTVVASLNNANYTGTATGTLIINKADQLISFPWFGFKELSSPDFELLATVNTALPLTYTSSNPLVAEVYQDAASGNVWKIKIEGNGETDIVAYQAGNSNYNSASFTRKLTVSERTLPVSLLNFQAKVLSGVVNLNWKTASETDNKVFQIYRSGEDKAFVYIGEIAGAGYSSGNQNYVFYDRNPLIGNNYYRLVQVDGNGHSSNLGERVLNFNINGGAKLTAYPNPTSDKLYVSFVAGIYTSIEWIDYNGKVLQRVPLNAYQSNYVMSVGRYPASTYIIRLTGKQSATLKVVKN